MRNDAPPGGAGEPENSQCPIKSAAGAPSSATSFSFYSLLWGAPAASGAPTAAITATTPVATTGITGYNEAANDAAFSQARQPGQSVPLAQTRAVSNIPKASFTPAHQPGGLGKWVYPSEQQYFNAMKRKGYDPPEGDMSVILAIHNTVNELGWQKIIEWEHLRDPKAEPKLARFLGRPKDLSPKARFLVALGKEAPFDRHDWFVERDGEQVRYVLDFYAIKPGARAGAPVHLDVRPALDSPSALYDRVKWALTK